MGYGFYYKTNPDQADELNQWLQNQPETHTLSDYGYEIHFWSKSDEENSNKDNMYNLDIGEGYNNLGVALASNAEIVLDPWANLFKKIHDNSRFELIVLSSSCCLIADGYFEGENLRKITDNGNALSGNKKSEIIQKLNN